MARLTKIRSGKRWTSKLIVEDENPALSGTTAPYRDYTISLRDYDKKDTSITYRLTLSPEEAMRLVQYILKGEAR